MPNANLGALLRRTCAATALALISLTTEAATLSFDCISNNSLSNCTAGENQLSVNVSDNGGGTVLFWFTNAGPNASSIADVYFDDGSLLAISSLIDSDNGTGGNAGVDFSPDANPGNLPAANKASPDFTTTAGFSADSDPPVQPNGVNPGEYLGIIFSLQGTQTYADVLSELASGKLRIGLHVQGFTNGGSESFVNDPYVVPIPAAAWLLGSGLMGLVGVARRRII